MFDGELFEEAGVDVRAAGAEDHRQREEDEAAEDGLAVAEDERLERGGDAVGRAHGA